MRTKVIKLLIILLAIAYVIAGIAFLVTGSAGGLVFGLAFFGGSALLYLAIEAVKHLQNMEQLLKIALTEPEEPTKELESETVTDTDTTITTNSRKMRG